MTEPLGVVADIANPEEVSRVVDAGMKEFERLDYAFNNAGIGGKYSSFEDMEFENWDRVMQVNLSSVAYCMKYQIAAMKKKRRRRDHQ